MAVSIDIVEGSMIKTWLGYEVIRTAIVRGLVGLPHAIQKNALDEVIVITGSIGAAHPTVAASKISRLSSEILSPTVVKIEIRYQPPKAPGETDSVDLQVGTTVTQVETNRDVNGNPVTLEYEYPVDYAQDERRRLKTEPQGGLMNKLTPESSIICTRREWASPASISREFAGTVNDGGWSMHAAAPARTWLCTGIVGRSDDGGRSYRVTYTFQFREDAWDETLFFINPDDGKPPDDLVLGVGEKTVILYVEKDFDDLGIVV